MIAPPADPTRTSRTCVLGRAALACAVLVVATGCPKRPEFGMESPGRPEVTWHNDDGETPGPQAERTEQDTERALLAEYRELEQSHTEDLAMARTLSGLAILRRQQGALAEAEGLYERALAIREREQGPNHPDVAATLNNLAGVQAAEGDYDGAQPLLERALHVRQAALGPDDVLTAESLNNLALLYAAQGNASAAESLYKQAVAVLEKNGGTRAGDLDRVLDNYAALLDDTGREQEADALRARARILRAARSTASAPAAAPQ